MAWFRERYDDRQAVAADAQGLIDCASPIDNFMRRRRLDARARRDSFGQQSPMLLQEAMAWHERFVRTGTMKPD